MFDRSTRATAPSRADFPISQADVRDRIAFRLALGERPPNARMSASKRMGACDSVSTATRPTPVATRFVNAAKASIVMLEPRGRPKRVRPLGLNQVAASSFLIRRNIAAWTRMRARLCRARTRARPGMLDWDDLRFFLAIARHGNLTTAANALHVAQSTVGRRLASLESSSECACSIAPPTDMWRPWPAKLQPPDSTDVSLSADAGLVPIRYASIDWMEKDIQAVIDNLSKADLSAERVLAIAATIGDF